jgi:hypothetical protein
MCVNECSGPAHQRRNTARLNSVSNIVGKFATGASMAQEFRPGEIVPQSVVSDQLVDQVDVVDVFLINT